MLFATPIPTPHLIERLGELDELRKRLGDEVGTASPWLGTLRRQVRASSVESSTSIEGFSVPRDDAVALVGGEEPSGPADDENRMAVACYARAMDHVGVMATDPAFSWSDRAILDLHFDACYFQRDQSPGQWRTGPISVTRDDQILYCGPDGDDVPGLMSKAVEWLENGDLDANVVLRAAMAHLHVVSVHPFRDGNGRVSRIIQSLVLAREGILSPEFGSIEEYLGENTKAYYAALQAVQGGQYQPERDASQWVEFCVEAHLAQADQRLKQVKEARARWEFLEAVVEEQGWPDRLVIALEQSVMGRTDRATYGEEGGVSPATASNDFRRLLDAGLVEQEGRGRNIRYRASEALRIKVADALSDPTV